MAIGELSDNFPCYEIPISEMIGSSSKVEQVAAKVRTLIEDGRFEKGRLPSEPSLAESLGASRATVRQALERLALDGLIARKHGVGTFVNSHVQAIRTRLEEVWDFDEMIRASGYRSSVRHIKLDLQLPAPKVAEKLAMDSAQEVLTTANVFMADDIPVIYVVDIIPASLVNQAYREEELHGPVYTFLRSRCDQQVDHNITEVLPVMADKKLGDLLDCRIGSPLHYFEEIGFNAQSQPIIYSEEYYRPAFFQFKVVRKMTTLHR